MTFKKTKKTRKKKECSRELQLGVSVPAAHLLSAADAVLQGTKDFLRIIESFVCVNLPRPSSLFQKGSDFKSTRKFRRQERERRCVLQAVYLPLAVVC